MGGAQVCVLDVLCVTIVVQNVKCLVVVILRDDSRVPSSPVSPPRFDSRQCHGAGRIGAPFGHLRRYLPAPGRLPMKAGQKKVPNEWVVDQGLDDAVREAGIAKIVQPPQPETALVCRTGKPCNTNRQHQ